MNAVPQDKLRLEPAEPWEEVEISTDFSAPWNVMLVEDDAGYENPLADIEDDEPDTIGWSGLEDSRDDLGGADWHRLPPMASLTVTRTSEFKIGKLTVVRSYSVIASSPRKGG